MASMPWGGPMVKSCAGLQGYTEPMWERACPRLRFNIQHLCCLAHRNRGQARSHRYSVHPGE
ncbi:hypothetical protein EI534_21430 [Pseudomonas frederiksbergensis]|nr:hypothetical protein [Pseudomonas frederiksbergensis]